MSIYGNNCLITSILLPPDAISADRAIPGGNAVGNKDTSDPYVMLTFGDQVHKTVVRCAPVNATPTAAHCVTPTPTPL